MACDSWLLQVPVGTQTQAHIRIILKLRTPVERRKFSLKISSCLEQNVPQMLCFGLFFIEGSEETQGLGDSRFVL